MTHKVAFKDQYQKDKIALQRAKVLLKLLLYEINYQSQLVNAPSSPAKLFLTLIITPILAISNNKHL